MPGSITSRPPSSNSEGGNNAFEQPVDDLLARVIFL